MSASTHQHFHKDGTVCHCDHHETGADALTAIDVVCGMTVVKAGAVHIATHEGQAYFFCSAACRSKFMDDPRAYLQSRTGGAASHDHHRELPVHPHAK